MVRARSVHSIAKYEFGVSLSRGADRGVIKGLIRLKSN